MSDLNYNDIIKSLKQYPVAKGKTLEFSKGNFSLFVTLFDDGRGYVEIFRCTPQQEKQKCSRKELDEIIKCFNAMNVNTKG